MEGGGEEERRLFQRHKEYTTTMFLFLLSFPLKNGKIEIFSKTLDTIAGKNCGQKDFINPVTLGNHYRC